MNHIQIERSLFASDVHDAMRNYVNERVPLLPVQVDGEDWTRTWLHNDPFFYGIHEQLREFASDVFGEPLKPSYTFLSFYRDQGGCPLHIDRPQCYRTIDYLIQQEDPEPWPIHIGAPHTDEEVLEIKGSDLDYPKGQAREERIRQETWETALLYPNDAVLYSGTHQFHYRDRPSRGRADLVFFHFVKESFDGPLT
jgi:hypothetical protein